MAIKFFTKNKFFKKISKKAGKARAVDIVERVTPFISKKDLTLDLGSGGGEVCKFLMERGYEVIPMDIRDLSYRKETRPVIYNGKKIPCKDNTFDVVLISTVLHHTPNPEEVLKEAKRVSAEKIIIIEDIYSNQFHKYITYFFDSLTNFEFIGHPHSNKKDEEWRSLFKSLNLELVEERYDRSWIFFKQVTYFLRKQ
ncbi:MAG: class I SAM-dependent methyltransferase [Candidatus Paceibacterota bacterium]